MECMKGLNLKSNSVLCRALENEAEDDFAEKVRLLFSLLDETCKDLKSIEIEDSDDIRDYIKAINSVQSVLLRAFPHQLWDTLDPHMDARDLALIRSCAKVMELSAMGYIEIASDELGNLEKEIHSLINDIRNSDLDKESKSQIISALRKIEDSILNYLVKGTPGVVKAGEEAIGKILSIPSLPNKDSERSLVRRALELIAPLVSFYQWGASNAKDAEAILKIFDRLGSSDVVAKGITQVQETAVKLIEGSPDVVVEVITKVQETAVKLIEGSPN
jgi:hypothetical protein